MKGKHMDDYWKQLRWIASRRAWVAISGDIKIIVSENTYDQHLKAHFARLGVVRQDLVQNHARRPRRMAATTRHHRSTGNRSGLLAELERTGHPAYLTRPAIQKVKGKRKGASHAESLLTICQRP